MREYVKTGVARKAYSKAGYASKIEPSRTTAADVSAHHLLKNPKIQEAIIAQQLRARTRHDYTIDTLLTELDEARAAAMPAQPSAAVQATTVKARLLGMIVDRKEVGAPGEFGALDTIQAIMALAAKELGSDAAATLAKLIEADPVTIDVIPNKGEENI